MDKNLAASATQKESSYNQRPLLAYCKLHYNATQWGLRCKFYKAEVKDS